VDSRVLENATITIKKGESVGIIGQSGGGKTTTMDIMLGLFEPQGGYAHMNGRDIRTCRNEWLSKVAYIPQQIFLMDASIKDNIIFGRSDIPYDKKNMDDVLRDAKLDEFVNGLKDGIETEVGEQGIRLSGGQRQRIGIARALYGNPDILFFDEATSALDNETESDIMESINSLKGKKTMVIIAHRLTTIENCDVVYKVENGKIEKA
jgi:ABC-type bacteriocin/lantibiotic exporter with double-glycine peptidase domain